jgi:putative DNA primase/helicase
MSPPGALPKYFIEATAEDRAERKRKRSRSRGNDEAAVGNGKDHDEALIAELVALSRLEYGKRRKSAAKTLGITAKELDRVIAERRAQNAEDTTALPHWTVEPWPSIVDGAELLNELRAIFSRYLILPKRAAETMALWVMHTWTFDASDVSPFLVFTSPEKRCGKTKALTALYWVTPRSELSSNISAPALFRYIEDVGPTLLVDEGDSFLKDNEEMRGILNSGHTRAAAHVIRCDGEDNKPRRFSTWAPKAIACIKRLADTLEDRSIIVPMQRKKRDENVERLRGKDSDEFATIRRKCLGWTSDNFGRLERDDPQVPEQLDDRAADNWRPLLAIAALAGGAWPKLARDAAIELSGEVADSNGTQLLADAYAVFESLDARELTSATLLAELTKDPARPWADWRHGKPMTAHALARMLKQFQIFPQEVSYPTRGNGYTREAFEDARARYLPPSILGSSGNPTAARTSRISQSSENTPSPSFEKVEETAVALALPELPSFETQKPEARAFPDPPGDLDLRPVRYVQPEDRPALGPPGDSLDDFK